MTNTKARQAQYQAQQQHHTNHNNVTLQYHNTSRNITIATRYHHIAITMSELQTVIGSPTLRHHNIMTTESQPQHCNIIIGKSQLHNHNCNLKVRGRLQISESQCQSQGRLESQITITKPDSQTRFETSMLARGQIPSQTSIDQPDYQTPHLISPARFRWATNPNPNPKAQVSSQTNLKMTNQIVPTISSDFPARMTDFRFPESNRQTPARLPT